MAVHIYTHFFLHRKLTPVNLGEEKDSVEE